MNFKLIFLLISVCIFENDVYGDSIPDNLKIITNLKEIVVEGAHRKDITGGVAFFPDKREKKFATDALSLLEQMALPELPYDAKSRGVTDAAGNPVNFFIDGQSASSKELKALNPKDVDRLDYFPVTTDAKFKGKNNVVNFVMKKYISGGYTKIDAKQFLRGNRGTYDLSSRYVYREMTFDAFVDGNYTYSKINGDYSNRYYDISYGGKDYSAIDESIYIHGNRSMRYTLGAYLRALWEHRSVTLSVTGGWNRENTPWKKNVSTTVYTPDVIGSDGYKTHATSLGVNPYLKTNLNLTLPGQQSLSVTMDIQHARHHNSSDKQLENLPNISNRNHNLRTDLFMMLDYSKQFNDRNSLGLSASLNNEWNRTTYFGSYQGLNHFRNIESSLEATYSHIFDKWTTLSFDIGFSLSRHKADGSRKSLSSPTGSISFRKRLNPRYTIAISSNVFTVGYFGDIFNDVTVRESELMWNRGNPSLRERIWWQSTLSNIFNFSRKFSLSVSGTYTTVFHQDVPVWERIQGYDGVVRTTVDNGNAHRVNVNTRATLRLLNKRLVLAGNFKYELIKLTRIYNRPLSTFEGYVNANWYGENWQAGAYLWPSTTRTEPDNFTRTYENWKYEFRFMYVLKDLQLRFTVSNPFRSKRSLIEHIHTPHYSTNMEARNRYSSNSFSLQLTYTIGYGKKVSRATLSASQILGSGALSM